MGWPWPFSSREPSGNRPNPSSAEKPSPNNGIALTDEQRIRIFGKPSNPTPTGEQQADAELDAFIKSFSAAENHSTASSRTISSSTSDSKRAERDEDQSDSLDRTLPDGSLNITPSVMYPRTMSCRQAFDQAFYCQSLGGKFNDVYRYGSLQSCSEQWGAFWFCMRTRTLPDKDKERQIRDYYAERDERKRSEKGSSEDVWEIRPVAVRRAFWKDPDVEDNENDGQGIRTTN